jgi:hypothetical protein
VSDANDSPLAGMLASALAFGEELKALDCKPAFVQLKIDGLVYTSTKLPASRGLELWPRVTALLGAALARAVVTGDGSGIGADAILRLAERAMTDGLLPLVRDLLSKTDCSNVGRTGKAGRVMDGFDDHFSGEYGHLLKVCVLALTHNLRGPTYGAR